MNNFILKKIIFYSDAKTLEKLIDMGFYIPHIGKIFQKKLEFYELRIKIDRGWVTTFMHLFSTPYKTKDEYLISMYYSDYSSLCEIFLNHFPVTLFYFENNDYFYIKVKKYMHQPMPFPKDEQHYFYKNRVLKKNNFYNIGDIDSGLDLDYYRTDEIFYDFIIEILDVLESNDRKVPFTIVKDLIDMVCNDNFYPKNKFEMTSDFIDITVRNIPSFLKKK